MRACRRPLTFAATMLVAWLRIAAALAQSAPPREAELAWRVQDLKARVMALSGATARPSGSIERTIAARDVTRAVVLKFLPFVEEDIAHSEAERAASELSSLERMVERLERPITWQERAQAARLTFASEKGRTVEVRGGALVARDGGGGRPVFLTGYGSFRRVREDVEMLPSVGANLIQIEIGPSHLIGRGRTVAQGAFQELTWVLDRAARAGAVVDLLISPHYFPEWMLDEVPELRKRRWSSLKYCIHHPSAVEFLRWYVQTVLAPIKDHPALFSVCLSNEPQNIEEPCELAARAWHTWLSSHHGDDIRAFNQEHGTDAHSFTDVPLPSPMDSPKPSALWLDFVRFNQEQFAGWHQMLADAVHEIAPNLPVHSKMMGIDLIGASPNAAASGIDATLAAQFSNISGNDGANRYSHTESDFAQGWIENAMGHDLQRSVSPAPVFNSENHPIDDRDERPVPGAHLRTAIWQAAVHGQAATSVWIWDRSFDHKSDFWSSVLERPEAIEAVGLTNIDMNRAAPELRSLQDAPADVEILHTVSSLVWDPQVLRQTEALYTALSFTGLKIGFVTERRLEAGQGPKSAVLFVPGNEHLSQSALRTLAAFPGRIVFVGSRNLLSLDDHGRPASVELRAEVIGEGHGASWRRLWSDLNRALPAWSMTPPVAVRDVAGKPIWGVEWRSARFSDSSGAWLVNLCNYRRQTVTVEVTRAGRSMPATDVLDGRRLSRHVELQPLETKLVRLGGKP